MPEYQAYDFFEGTNIVCNELEHTNNYSLFQRVVNTSIKSIFPEACPGIPDLRWYMTGRKGCIYLNMKAHSRLMKTLIHCVPQIGSLKQFKELWPDVFIPDTSDGVAVVPMIYKNGERDLIIIHNDKIDSTRLLLSVISGEMKRIYTDRFSWDIFMYITVITRLYNAWFDEGYSLCRGDALRFIQFYEFLYDEFPLQHIIDSDIKEIKEMMMPEFKELSHIFPHPAILEDEIPPTNYMPKKEVNKTPWPIIMSMLKSSHVADRERAFYGMMHKVAKLKGADNEKDCMRRR